MATKLKQGDPAPDFNLASDLGKVISLKEFLGKKVVLYFYPKDDTPGCTKQACEFRDGAADFDRKRTIVLGVSRDSIESHKKFKKKFSLNFPLLSDPDHNVHELYGAWGEKTLYGKKITGAIRTTVVIDEKGKILSHDAGVKAEGNAERTLKKIS